MLRIDPGYVEDACHVEYYHIITESPIMGRKKPPGENKHGRRRARKRLELYYQREAQANQKREEAIKKRIKTLAEYEKLCEESSKMWQDYLLSIKNVKHSTDAKKECEIVTFSDESDDDEEDDDDDLAKCILWKNNTLSKRDAKENNIEVVLKSILSNTGNVLHGFLSDIGIVPNEKERAVVRYGGQKVTLRSFKRLTGTKWLNDEVINFYHRVVLSERDRDMCACTLQRRSHFFSSFFLQELYQDHSKDLQKVGKYNFDAAEKTWQRNKTVLFNCHFLVFPNHVGGNHWTTIIVNMHEKTITHYNSLKVRYYNTSKGESHYAKLDGILQYLQTRYIMEYGNGRFPIEEWKIVDSIVGVPQQRNGYDCGVFCCMISDFVSRRLPLDNLTQNHIDKCREIIARDIMYYNGK